MKRPFVATGLLVLVVICGCGRQGRVRRLRARARRDHEPPADAPRQALLRRAGGELDLAAYELDEIGEGFDDVLKYHPTHKESPVAPKDAIPRIVTEPLRQLKAAVEKKDSAAFGPAFDALTVACNNCHEATNFGFNIVQTPTANPYPNQQFRKSKKE